MFDSVCHISDCKKKVSPCPNEQIFKKNTFYNREMGGGASMVGGMKGGVREKEIDRGY